MSEERTNVYKGEFSPTGVISALCLRKFYYRKVLGLVSNQPAMALYFGSAMHKCVETYYIKKSEVDHVTAKMLAVQAFVDTWNSFGVVGDDKRNLGTGLIIANNYCDYYAHDSADIIPIFVEAPQWVAMPNGTHMLMKIDRVRRDGNLITVVDTKTTSGALTDYYFRQFENDLQTSLYYFGSSEILGECNCIQIDGIKVPPPPEKSATIPFARRTFHREELQISDAVNTYCRITDYIIQMLDKYHDDEDALPQVFYCNQTLCGAYNGCEYLPICKYGFNHPSVQVDFDRMVIEKPKGENSDD